MARDELLATYLTDLPHGREAAAADAFATGQTIGTWLPVPGITEQMRAAHGGRVVDLRRGAHDERLLGERTEDAWVLTVAFPIVNFGQQFPMLFTTLLGNDPSTSIPARLVALDLPVSFTAGFPGPQHGIAGWRALTGVHGRPLLLNMIKPCTGYPPAVGAGFVREVALGGVDLIKDDELLADPGFAPVAQRAATYRAALDEVARDTGHRARYVANVTTRPGRLVATARAALDAGADALMVNVLAVGLDALAELAEASIGAPILAHSAGVETMTGARRAGFGQAVLLGDLVRLAGADAILISTPHATRPLDPEVFRSIVDRMRRPSPELRASLPMVGGGLTADHVAPIVRDLGTDVMFAVGGAIQGHPAGATAGARAVRSAIEAVVQSTAQVG